MYQNGTIYADSSHGVSISDVRNALALATHDLATLCESENISIWARYKPISINCEWNGDGTPKVIITPPADNTITINTAAPITEKIRRLYFYGVTPVGMSGSYDNAIAEIYSYLDNPPANAVVGKAVKRMTWPTLPAKAAHRLSDFVSTDDSGRPIPNVGYRHANDPQGVEISITAHRPSGGYAYKLDKAISVSSVNIPDTATGTYTFNIPDDNRLLLQFNTRYKYLYGTAEEKAAATGVDGYNDTGLLTENGMVLTPIEILMGGGASLPDETNQQWWRRTLYFFRKTVDALGNVSYRDENNQASPVMVLWCPASGVSLPFNVDWNDSTSNISGGSRTSYLYNNGTLFGRMYEQKSIPMNNGQNNVVTMAAKTISEVSGTFHIVEAYQLTSGNGYTWLIPGFEYDLHISRSTQPEPYDPTQPEYDNSILQDSNGNWLFGIVSPYVDTEEQAVIIQFAFQNASSVINDPDITLTVRLSEDSYGDNPIDSKTWSEGELNQAGYMAFDLYYTNYSGSQTTLYIGIHAQKNNKFAFYATTITTT